MSSADVSFGSEMWHRTCYHYKRKASVHQEPELRVGALRSPKTFLFDRLDSIDRFMRVPWVSHCLCIAARLQIGSTRNRVGVPALVECITQVKINPRAQREAFFFTLSGKPRSVQPGPEPITRDPLNLGSPHTHQTLFISTAWDSGDCRIDHFPLS